MHDCCDGLSVARRVLVRYTWNAVVNIQITGEPVVILELLDVVQASSKEQAKAPTALNVFFREHAAAFAAIRGFKHVVADLEIAAELLALRVGRLKLELWLQLTLEVVVDFSVC